MLIGENPGGLASSFAGENFIALEKTRWDLPAMEYLEYKGDTSYPLAGKTVRLFEKAGHPELLGKSVKTNTCFFRTRRSANVRKEDWTWCMDVLREIVGRVEPAALLCESISTLDWVMQNLYAGDDYRKMEEYKRTSRKYVSYSCQKEGWPRLVIGITHLTGSRPSNKDMEEIATRLKNDLDRFL
jgi:hypothetical protein